MERMPASGAGDSGSSPGGGAMSWLGVAVVGGWGLALLFAALAYKHWRSVGAWRVRAERAIEMLKQTKRQFRALAESQYYYDTRGWENEPTQPGHTSIIVDERLIKGD